MSEARWSPIVWGRTYAADKWWRAVPGDLDVTQLTGLVEGATVAAGVELDRPRYLLARRFGHWVTGVACPAATVSDTMTEDVKGRPLNVFVGWAAPVKVGDTPPRLPDLRAGVPDWAAVVYDEWMGKDWDSPRGEIGPPHRTEPGPAPWTPAPRDLDPIGSVLAFHDGVVELHPARLEDRTWAAGLVGADPFVLVVGWPRQRSMPLRYLTHACVDGLEASTEVEVHDGLDLAGERDVPEVGALVAARVDDRAGSVDTGEPPSDVRRTSWLPWNRARELDRLGTEVARLAERLAVVESEIADLRLRYAGDSDETAAPPGSG